MGLRVGGISRNLHSIVTELRTKIRSHWAESTNKLHRPIDCRLSSKLVSTFTNRGCHVVIVTDPYGHILDFLD
jgi:hypothetical protein